MSHKMSFFALSSDPSSESLPWTLLMWPLREYWCTDFPHKSHFIELCVPWALLMCDFSVSLEISNFPQVSHLKVSGTKPSICLLLSCLNNAFMELNFLSHFWHSMFFSWWDVLMCDLSFVWLLKVYKVLVKKKLWEKGLLSKAKNFLWKKFRQTDQPNPIMQNENRKL